MLKNMSFDWGSVIDRMELVDKELNLVRIPGKELSWSTSILYPNCQYLDPFEYIDFKENVPLEIAFWFNKIENIGVSLFIEDKIKSLRKRSLKSNMLAYNGPEIEIKDLMLPEVVKIVLRQV